MAATKMRQAWWGALAVLVLTLPALWPLFRPGFLVTDDGRFHVYRIAAVADAWQHGVIYPRLFPDFGFGYGQAVLNFYAPLSYAPGAAFSILGFSPVAATELTIALGFVLAALAAYAFGLYVWGSWGGLLAAIAYTYFPYHLADAYVRGAVPEHFAFVWLPLILWAWTAVFRTQDETTATKAALGGALAWAGLIYTHNLTALLMVSAAGFYLLALGVWTGRWRRLGWIAVSALIGALLSAPLWLPFVMESGSVGIALGPSDGYRRHLAPLSATIQFEPLYRYRAQAGSAADHPLSWTTPALILLVGGLAGWRGLRRKTMTGGPLIAYFLALTTGAAFMATAPSLPVWMPLEPALAHLQYPWRFLTLAGVGVMGLGAALPSLLRADDPAPSPLGRAAAVVIGAVLLLQPLLNAPANPLPMTSAEAWAPDRMWQEDAEAGQVGATWTGEFLPLTVKEQRWALGRSKEDMTDGPSLSPRPDVRIAERRYDGLTLDVDSTAPLSLRLHQFYLPMWRAQVDGEEASLYPSGELALVTADTAAGSRRVTFRFGPTGAWVTGWVLEMVGALMWSLLAWRVARRENAHWLQVVAVALPVFILVLDLNALGIGQRRWTPAQPASGPATFGEVATLIGYDLEVARGEKAVDVTLYWFALRENGTDYKTFVHLLGSDGQVVAQHDGDPGGGYTPTTRWMQGEIIPDRHRLRLQDGTADATFGLRAGMYAVDASGAVVNLPMDPPSADGRADLGAVEMQR